MATRETLPVDSEPYTKGYYMIWALLSLGAVLYIAFLAFGSGSSSIIRISKISEKEPLTKIVSDQSKRIGSAMAIATRAADKSTANTTAIKSLEKRVQLLTWKLADGAPVTGVLSSAKKQLSTTANSYVKQVMGSGGDNTSIVGHIIPAVPDAKKIVTTKVVKTVAIDSISSIAGVVDNAPTIGSSIIDERNKNLSTLNPLKVAALAAGIAKSAESVLDKKPSPETVAPAAVKKVALKVEDAAPKAELVVKKSPFKTMPLPVRKSYGVRLTSGRTVESLRLTWDLINEMNRPILKGLQTRFIEGSSEMGMPYRLIAGPMVSTGQAKSLCDKLHQQNINCDVTVFQGRKL